MYRKNNVKKIMPGVMGIVCVTVTGCSADRGDAVMKQHDITVLSGESRDEMVEEWTQYLKSEYADYAK